MSIDFQCGRCGKRYRTGDASAGKTARCKQCGDAIVVPSPQPEEESDVIELVEEAPRPARSPIPGRLASPGLAPQRGGGPGADRPAAGPAPRNPLAWGGGSPGGSSSTSPRPSAAAGPPAKGPSGAMAWLRRAAAVVVALGLLGLRVYSRWDRNPPRQDPADARSAPEATAAAPEGPRPPTSMPRFGDRGPGRQIEPGVIFREIPVGSGEPDPQAQPGHAGKLWLYLPAGQDSSRGRCPAS